MKTIFKLKLKTIFILYFIYTIVKKIENDFHFPK